MPSFEKATAVHGGEGTYHARLDPDWCVWSPAGGVLVATALRAAGESTSFPLPLSMSCHFLAVPQLAEITLRVSSLRRTRVAESLRVSMLQGERPILEMLVWSGQRIEGYRHSDLAMPDVPSAARLESRRIPPGAGGLHTLWQQLEQRACGPLHWERSQPGEPRQRDWIRLRSYALPTENDPAREPGTALATRDRESAFLEAGRIALILDCFTWPAAGHAHVGDPRFIAPTISLNTEFHQLPGSEWLLSDAHSPTARDGCIAIQNRIWSEHGALLATASGTLICRPRPKRS